MRKLIVFLSLLLLTSCDSELKEFAKSITCDTGFEQYRQIFAKKKPLHVSYKFVDAKEHGVISIHSQFDRLELFASFNPDLKGIYYLALYEKELFGNNNEILILDCSKDSTRPAN